MSEVQSFFGLSSEDQIEALPVGNWTWAVRHIFSKRIFGLSGCLMRSLTAHLKRILSLRADPRIPKFTGPSTGFRKMWMSPMTSASCSPILLRMHRTRYQPHIRRPENGQKLFASVCRRRYLKKYNSAFSANLMQMGCAMLRLSGDKLFMDYEASHEGLGYVRPTVQLEFGARSTGEPAEVRDVSCDLNAAIGDLVFRLHGRGL